MPTTLGIHITLTGNITISEVPSGGIVSASLGGAGEGSVTTGATTQTIGGLSIGDVPSSSEKRYVIADIGQASASSNRNITPTLVTIGGVVATLAAEVLSPSISFKQYSGIYFAEVPSGITADVVIVADQAFVVASQLYIVRIPTAELLSVFSNDTAEGSTTLTCTVDTPANGIAVASAQFRNGESTPSISYGGTLGLATHYRFDVLSDENFYAGSAYPTSAATGLTSTITDASAAGLESTSAVAVFVSS